MFILENGLQRKNRKMMRYLDKLLIITLIVAYAHTEGTQSIDIVHILGTTNVNGEIEPCGWKKKPLGGLARKSTVIDQIKATSEEFVVVDAGNLFFKKNNLEPGITTEIASLNSEIIVNAFNKIGCDAFSPGSHDFALGLDYLLKIEKNANFPFISANIRDVLGTQIFRPYNIVSRGSLDIGFIGLASQFSHPDLQINDPIESLKEIIDEVNSQSDIVVLLFNAEERDLLALQNSNLPIDLIYRSNSKKRSNDGGGKAIPVYSAGDRGKYLYDVKVSIKDKNEKLIDISAQEHALENSKKRLERMRKNHPQDSDLKVIFANDPQTLSRVKSYERQIDQANYNLENAINTLTLNKYELNKTIADKPEILKIVDSGKEKINIIGAPYMDSQGRLPGDSHHGHSH